MLTHSPFFIFFNVFPNIADLPPNFSPTKAISFLISYNRESKIQDLYNHWSYLSLAQAAATQPITTGHPIGRMQCEDCPPTVFTATLFGRYTPRGESLNFPDFHLRIKKRWLFTFTVCLLICWCFGVFFSETDLNKYVIFSIIEICNTS